MLPESSDRKDLIEMVAEGQAIDWVARLERCGGRQRASIHRAVENCRAFGARHGTL